MAERNRAAIDVELLRVEPELLANRNGLGVGRVYSIEVTCTNAAGLNSKGSVSVTVSHDRR